MHICIYDNEIQDSCVCSQLGRARDCTPPSSLARAPHAREGRHRAGRAFRFSAGARAGRRAAAPVPGDIISPPPHHPARWTFWWPGWSAAGQRQCWPGAWRCSSWPPLPHPLASRSASSSALRRQHRQGILNAARTRWSPASTSRRAPLDATWPKYVPAIPTPTSPNPSPNPLPTSSP